jgi:hypothetical protein
MIKYGSELTADVVRLDPQRRSAPSSSSQSFNSTTTMAEETQLPKLTPVANPLNLV